MGPGLNTLVLGPDNSVHHYPSQSCRISTRCMFSAYSFTKAPSYFWALSVDLRNVLCQLCPRFKTRWIIQFSFSIFAIIHHRDTRKHPDHGSWLTSQCLVPHPSHPLESWQSQSSRMSGWCDLCIEILESRYFLVEYLRAWVKLSWQKCGQCFEKGKEKGELSRKIIEKVTNDPFEIVRMTFISVREKTKKITNKHTPEKKYFCCGV